MKKIIIYSLFLVMGSLVSTSCGDDPISSCAKLASLAVEYSNAASAYAINTNATTCAAYKTAGNKYLDALKGCSTTTGAQIDALEAQIDALTC